MENLKKFSEKLGEVKELTGLSLIIKRSQLVPLLKWVEGILDEGLNVDYDIEPIPDEIDGNKYYNVYIHNIYKDGISFIHIGDLLMRLKNS